MRRRWALALSLGAAACMVGPDYHRPRVLVPNTYVAQERAKRARERRLDPRWWHAFDDGALDELELRALVGNPGLAAAIARVAQARALTAGAEADLYPSIAFGQTFDRSKRPGSDAANHYRLAFDLSYEVDLWGKVRRTVEAAEARERAAADEYGVARLTLTANVAVDYFTVRSLDAQVAVLARAIASSRRQLELVRIKHDAGLVGPTDVLQAQAQLESTLAQWTEALRQRTNTEHALAVLVGQAPSTVLIGPGSLGEGPPTVPAGLPSELLRRRPDVAAAEEALIATSASIGVAEALLYPSFSLTGSAGLASTSLLDAVSWGNRLWSVGAGLLVPIFEGGRLRAGVEHARASYDEALAGYREAILQALADVEGSLNDLSRRAAADVFYTHAADAARENLRLSQLQYDQGLVDYLQVLDAQRSLLDNELQAVRTRGQRYVSAVLLVKSLGGNWSPKQRDSVLEHAKAHGPE